MAVSRAARRALTGHQPDHDVVDYTSPQLILLYAPSRNHVISVSVTGFDSVFDA
jgi:hypothetical protein